MTDYIPEESAPSASTVVPHSREAEEAVIGAVFINPEVYYDVAQFLSADDFYIHRHQWIWDAFTSLHEQRVPVAEHERAEAVPLRLEEPALAARRRIAPEALPRLLRGELDWIVMRALEKERARRYETASGLAADVERHRSGAQAGREQRRRYPLLQHHL